MSDRFFLDTNVLAYTFDVGAPKKARVATKLVHHAIGTRQGVVSFQVVQEFFQVAFRRFPDPFSVADAEQYLATVFRPLLAVHSSPALYLEGLRLRSKFRLAWYDSLIVAAALQAECETLYSEDFQHGQEIEGLQIQNPFLMDERKN